MFGVDDLSGGGEVEVSAEVRLARNEDAKQKKLFLSGRLFGRELKKRHRQTF